MKAATITQKEENKIKKNAERDINEAEEIKKTQESKKHAEIRNQKGEKQEERRKKIEE